MSEIFDFQGIFEAPKYATLGSSGFDLRAEIADPIRLAPNSRVLIGTKLYLTDEFPQDWELQIRSRSGLALKHGVIVLNAPATIDADYRQEVGVILYNSGDEAFYIEPGDRIAQGVLAQVIRTQQGFTDAKRSGGFGSTGNS